jgi:hypothetical protein
MEPAIGARDEKHTARRLRSQTVVVKGRLKPGINVRVRTAPCCTKKLIDIAYILVGREASGLPRSVGENQDISGHDILTA